MKSTHSMVAALLLAAMAHTGAANAGVITSGFVYNNTAGEYGASYGVNLLSNQSGLSSGFVDGSTSFAAYTGSGVTHATAEGNGAVTWLSSPGTPQFPFFLDFNLGSARSILSLALWNGTAGNAADINAFQIFTSSVADFSVSTAVGSFNNPMGSSGPELVSIFDLTDSVGQYVRLQVNSHYGNPCCAGIGEVAWDVSEATQQVPEPGSAALLGLSIAALGLSRRRKA